MKRRKYDVLFLDFYGTLVTGDREAVETTCARVIDDLAIPLSPHELAVVWGHCFFDTITSSNGDGFLTLFECECATLRETLTPWTTDFDATVYANLLKRYWVDPPEACDARSTLAELDIPVCIVSNADTADVHEAIRRRGFRVDAVVTSEDTQSYKPHAAIFEAALARMQVSPDRVLHAGDSLHSDVGGAQALGIASCWVCYEQRILDVGDSVPDHKINNLSKLRSIL